MTTTVANDSNDHQYFKYTTEMISVGRLNKSFEHFDGPQRNRPKDHMTKRGNSTYKDRLRSRFKDYGEFDPILIRPRVVSRRKDGTLYPLDGNGSNHWYEEMFGPEYPVESRIVDNLSTAEENRLFKMLQSTRKVSSKEIFGNDAEFDENSNAAIACNLAEKYGIENLLPSSVDKIMETYDAGILEKTVSVLATLTADGWISKTRQPSVRTCASLPVMVAILIGKHKLNAAMIEKVLKDIGPDAVREINALSRRNGGNSMLRNLGKYFNISE